METHPLPDQVIPGSSLLNLGSKRWAEPTSLCPPAPWQPQSRWECPQLHTPAQPEGPCAKPRSPPLPPPLRKGVLFKNLKDINCQHFNKNAAFFPSFKRAKHQATSIRPASTICRSPVARAAGAPDPPSTPRIVPARASVSPS